MAPPRGRVGGQLYPHDLAGATFGRDEDVLGPPLLAVLPLVEHQALVLLGGQAGAAAEVTPSAYRTH